MADYYKLGKQATSFYDAAQPTNKSLLIGQVLPLEETAKVRAWSAAKGLESATEKEYESYLKKAKAEEKKREEERSTQAPRNLTEQVNLVLKRDKELNEKEKQLAEWEETLEKKEAELNEKEKTSGKTSSSTAAAADNKKIK